MFRVNLHPVIAWISRNFLIKRRSIWKWSACYKAQTHNLLVSKHTLNYLAKLAKWLSCVMNIICMVHLPVWFYHITYVFWLNLQFAITWMLRNYFTKTESKWLSVRLETKELWVQVPLQSFTVNFQIWHTRRSMTLMQLQNVDSLLTRMWHNRNAKSILPPR